jgi:hypothetical protein
MRVKMEEEVVAARDEVRRIRFMHASIDRCMNP